MIERNTQKNKLHLGKLVGHYAFELSKLSLPNNITQKLRSLALRHTFSDIKKELITPFQADIVPQSFLSLAEQLNPYLDSYDLIIGDDASGRLPTLFIRKLINRRRQERGLPPAKCLFIAGNYTAPVDLDLPDATDEYARTLIVTEWIYSGRTINNIFDNVKSHRDKQRIHVATAGREDRYCYFTENFPIFTGGYAKNDPKDCVDSYLHSGRSGEYIGLYSTTTNPHAETIKGSRANRHAIRQARESIAIMADTIYSLLPPVYR